MILVWKDFMLNTFSPALDEFFKETNPEKYEWKGAYCKQAAVFSARMLSLGMPEFRFTVWDGMFTDDGKIAYNHAWCYGRKENIKLLVDLGRTTKPKLFEFVQGNRYPKTGEYESMKELKRIQLNWQELYQKSEYFSGLKGNEFLQKICLKIQGGY